MRYLILAALLTGCAPRVVYLTCDEQISLLNKQTPPMAEIVITHPVWTGPSQLYLIKVEP